MHFDGWQTMEGRHLVAAYAAVIFIHAAYLTHLIIQWRKTTKTPPPLTPR